MSLGRWVGEEGDDDGVNKGHWLGVKCRGRSGVVV